MKTYKITIRPRELTFYANEDESVLDAARRYGFQPPFSCQSGSCQRCENWLIAGSAVMRNKNHTKQEFLNGGNTPILSCLTYPESDIVIRMDNVLAPNELPVFTVNCEIEKTEFLNRDVLRVILKLPAGKKIQFHAGQYVECHFNNNISAFSIANRDCGDRRVELHIRAMASNPNSIEAQEFCQSSHSMKVTIPKGSCIFSSSITKPTIFICGSTGFAQMKAMLEQAFEDKCTHPLYLYWGAYSPEDLYLDKLPREWEKVHQNFHYIPVISGTENSASPNKGSINRTGLVHHAVLEDFPNLKGMHIFGSGSPNMIYAVFDDFSKHGLEDNCMSADVFDYAPRK